MPMLCDRYAIDDSAQVRRTSSGYLVAMPRVARTGIQLYRGDEVGRPDMPVVRVMRTEDEVFRKDSMRSFGHKPITDDHPPVLVDARNWKQYAKGQTDGDVARDGDFIRVPMMLSDADTISKVADGKVELSVGYTCELDWQEGKTTDGQSYDAIQRDIKVNHIAVVDAARGGPALRIGDGSGAHLDFKVYAEALSAIAKGNINKDEALADVDAMLAFGGKGEAGYPIMKDGMVDVSSLRAARTKAAVKGDGDIVAAIDSMLALIDDPPAIADGKAERTEPMTLKTHTIDGISVEMSDTAIQVVDRQLKALNDTVADLTKRLTDAEAAKAKLQQEKEEEAAKAKKEAETKDAEIATLRKQVEDAAVTPEKLDAMVADRAEIAAKAKFVMGDKASSLIVDGKSVADIRKQVVLAKIGDAAKDWNDEQIKVSFDTLTAGVDAKKLADQASASHAPAGHRPGGYLDTARDFSQPPVGDARMKALSDRDARLSAAWQNGGMTKQ